MLLVLPGAYAQDSSNANECDCECPAESAESAEAEIRRRESRTVRTREEDGGYKGTVGIYCLDRKGRFTKISPEDLNDRYFDECVDEFFEGLEARGEEPGAEPSSRSGEEERRARFRKAYEGFLRAIRALK